MSSSCLYCCQHGIKDVQLCNVRITIYSTCFIRNALLVSFLSFSLFVNNHYSDRLLFLA